MRQRENIRSRPSSYVLLKIDEAFHLVLQETQGKLCLDDPRFKIQLILKQLYMINPNQLCLSKRNVQFKTMQKSKRVLQNLRVRLIWLETELIMLKLTYIG